MWQKRRSNAVSDSVGSHTDAIVMERLSDDIDEFANMRPTAGISVGRTTARNALLEYGIAKPQQSPFYQPDALSASTNADPTNNDVLDPDLPIPSGDFPAEPTASFTGPMSDISDDDLDMLLLRLRTHYRRAGLSMLNGMLHQLGHRVAIERICQSLLRIDPVWRIFERICDHFTRLEVQYGLDINNVAHIWLLHLLFLGTINTQLTFFAESWNQHRIQIRNGANWCPTDMFVFDMYVNGVHGDQLPQEEEDLGKDKLEVYGIDWQGLCNNNILHSQAQNNSTTEGSSSWVGHTGTPPDLSQVIVQLRGQIPKTVIFSSIKDFLKKI
ncbi:hypothetical protein K438DRAFT_2061381 [Mycena galopus ATCC 62051]|nr:hypothetical protein K438DRAFT_2061381 [Mycena galopus ATCC 62051]